MNKAKLLQSILELHKAVKDGNMEKMCRCAYELNALFEREVPEPLEGYDAALMRFKMAEAMVAAAALAMVILHKGNVIEGTIASH